VTKDNVIQGWVEVDKADRFRQILSHKLAHDYVLRERMRSALKETVPAARQLRILDVLREVKDGV
jgi:hypothetical protein